jgi:hypothetical protein
VALVCPVLKKHHCAFFCEEGAAHNLKRRIALALFDPSQNSHPRRWGSSKQQSRQRLPRLAALPSSPYVPFSWTADVGPSNREVWSFTFVPTFRSKRDALVRPGKNSASAGALKLRSVDKRRELPLAHAERTNAKPAPTASVDGHDTRSLAHYLGHRNLQSTARYTALAPDRFARFWHD